MDPTLVTAILSGLAYWGLHWAFEEGKKVGRVQGRAAAEAEHRKELCDLNIKLLIAKGVLPPE